MIRNSRMDSDSSASESHVDIANDKQHEPIINPLLCEQCQPWDNIWSFEPQRGAYMSLRELSYHTYCLICRAILTVVNSHRTESESFEKWPASRTFVRNDGPFFLDTGYYPAYHPSRVDTSNPTNTAVRLVMNLNISMLLEDPGSPEDINNGASSIDMTPQFCLYFSTSATPHLAHVESWEIPFFDISLLRTWL